ncbi:MAG: EF-P beta-lysylation protein EpmB, partial [Thiogranum sp.]
MRIIPGTEGPQQPPLWQTLLSQAITEPEELLRELDLPLDLLPGSLKAGRAFRLRVPRGFVARMRHGDPLDPL